MSAEVNLTVKELIELHGSVLAGKIDRIGDKVDALDNKVDGLETRVQAIGSAADVQQALAKRQDLVDDRTLSASWSRKDRLVAGVGVGFAILIGVINTLITVGGPHG